MTRRIGWHSDRSDVSSTDEISGIVRRPGLVPSSVLRQYQGVFTGEPEAVNLSFELKMPVSASHFSQIFDGGLFFERVMTFDTGSIAGNGWEYTDGAQLWEDGGDYNHEVNDREGYPADGHLFFSEERNGYLVTLSGHPGVGEPSIHLGTGSFVFYGVFSIPSSSLSSSVLAKWDTDYGFRLHFSGSSSDRKLFFEVNDGNNNILIVRGTSNLYDLSNGTLFPVIIQRKSGPGGGLFASDPIVGGEITDQSANVGDLNNSEPFFIGGHPNVAFFGETRCTSFCIHYMAWTTGSLADEIIDSYPVETLRAALTWPENLT